MTRSSDAARSALILTHFFPPEPCAAANRADALRAALLEAGFAVEVVTGVATFPSGTMPAAERVVWPRTVRDGAATLTRVCTYASRRLTGRNRIANWLSVSLAASLYVTFARRRYDIVIVTIPPITLALPAICAKWRHRARLVVDVRDAFPEVAIAMGYWRERSPIASAVGSIARRLYRAADLVVCVTDAGRTDVVARGSDPHRTIVASNGFDPVDDRAPSPYRPRAGEFVAAFAGNMGLATGLDIILDAAKILRDEPRVAFVLAGDGADRHRLAARVRDEGLANVRFVGAVPRAAANALLAIASVSIVPLHGALTGSLPTKLFDALVLGCPVICCARGEAREFAERSGGGVVVEPGDGAGLATAILTLADDPAARARLAGSGSAFVRERYDRAAIMRDLASRLTRLQK
ncbi:MAG: glycosyltransferase family 4 protein [Vulcanimicrobiaceae bacterium]